MHVSIEMRATRASTDLLAFRLDVYKKNATTTSKMNIVILCSADQCFDESKIICGGDAVLA